MILAGFHSTFTIPLFASLTESLTDNGKTFKFGYDTTSSAYGYYTSEGGADTFVPFSSKIPIQWVAFSGSKSSSITLPNGKYLLVNDTYDHDEAPVTISGDASLVNPSMIGFHKISSNNRSSYCVWEISVQGSGTTGTFTISFTSTGDYGYVRLYPIDKDVEISSIGATLSKGYYAVVTDTFDVTAVQYQDAFTVSSGSISIIGWYGGYETQASNRAYVSIAIIKVEEDNTIISSMAYPKSSFGSNILLKFI